MCGICGFTNFEDKELLKHMCDVIKHRGPDDEGYFFDKDISLGMRRLSIIDLKTGHQPMHNEDESIWTVCNGEIYNFKEIKKNLEDKGHRFYTHTDVEVIPHAYEEYGDDFPKLFNGMYGLALWDTKKRKLIMARDKIGIKPLYYTIVNNNLIFGSEIKSILQYKEVNRKVDYQSLFLLLNLRYIPGVGTLFDGVSKVPPAHILVYQNGSIELKRYWDINAKANYESEEYYLKKIPQLLEKAIERHLIADVPIGVFLSGGMDSSIVTALASKLSGQSIKTFTVGFGESTDELKDAQVVADHFGTEHHTVMMDFDPLEVLPKLIWHIEEPRLNMFQENLVSQFASKYVKVALTGMGGDELYAGYDIHPYLNMSQNLRKFFIIPQRFSRGLIDIFSAIHKKQITLYEPIKRLNFFLSMNDQVTNYLVIRNGLNINPKDSNFFNKDFLKDKYFISPKKIYSEYFKSNDFLNNVFLAEFKTKMVDDFLLSSDKTYSANSLEGRVPLLDIEFVEFSFTIPPRYKIRNNQKKYLLRKAMKDILPEHTLKKRKWGFSYDITSIFGKNLKDYALSILSEKNIKKEGVFNYDYIKKILEHDITPKLRWHYYYLLLIISFEIWHKMYIESDEVKNTKLSIYDLL